MKIFRILLFAALMPLLTITASADHLSRQLMFTAKLDASQEVTPSTSGARGVAIILLSGSTDSLYLNASFTGLSSAVLSDAGVGLYIGKRGQESPFAILPLNNFMMGSTLSARVGGVITNKEVIASFMRGDVYINVKTENFPTGEIRGQFYLETDYGFHGLMSGSQMVPPVQSDATGLVIAKLSKDSTMLVVNAIVHGLSGPGLTAHLHQGHPGTYIEDEHPVELKLMGNTIRDTITMNSFEGDTMRFRQLITELLAGGIYVNIHTDKHLTGEIRGQLRVDSHLMFDAILTGNQEVPKVATQAWGIANIMLSPNLDTLDYQVMTDRLSGPIMMAHIHFGGVDTAGPIIIPLNVTSPNMVSGRFVLTTLAPERRDSILALMLEGRTYVNIHTEQHQPGEIRGQVYRHAREGFSFTIGGLQEVPPVVTTAMGTGMVSYDRDQTNLHYMIIVSGLSSNVVGAHFHTGRPGENGPPVFHLRADSANFGFWNQMSEQPFNRNFARMIRRDSIYFNIHTELYPNGEARGQVTRTPQQIIASVTEKPLISASDIALYPNPAVGNIMIAVSSEKPFIGTIILSDMRGTELYSTALSLHEGDNIIPLSLANFAAGTYIIKAEAGGKLLFTQKITKQ